MLVESAGPEVAVLAELGGHPVLVRQGRVLAAAFHPELSDDEAAQDGRRVHAASSIDMTERT